MAMSNNHGAKRVQWSNGKKRNKKIDSKKTKKSVELDKIIKIWLIHWDGTL